MKLAVAAAAGLLCVSGAAQAQGVVFSPRIGPTIGSYRNDSSFTISNPSGTPIVVVESDDSWEFAYGLQAGFGLAFSDFFGDVAIEYLSVDSDAEGAEFDRTDVLLTAGYLIDRRWSAFAGYRRGMQGDGAFEDDTFNESGFFVGGGVGGIEMGPLLFGASLAYNFSQAEDFPFQGDEFDYHGVSLKGSLSLQSLPQHSLQLRYQRFTGDDQPGTLIDVDGDGSADGSLDDIELTETYVQLTYIYAFAF